MRPELVLYQNHRLEKYSLDNSKENKGGIVFAGDSLFDFFMLKKYFGRDLPLINRGIAGIDTDFLLRHLKTLVWDLEPSKVFLLIGTNDIELGYDTSRIFNNLVEIISQLKIEAFQAEIYLVSLLPVNQEETYQKTVKNRTNQILKGINNQICVLSGVHYIDAFSKLRKDGQLDDDYTTDGLHLSPSGYDVLSQVLKPYI